MTSSSSSSCRGDGLFESGVQVFIPAALNRPTHTFYSICMVVQPTGQEWTVNRRYSQFLQLRKDVLHALDARGVSCPNCASFHRALAAFAFPPKALLRANKVVRRRVTALQDFLKLLVGRVFNDLPKCGICGQQTQARLRPFLQRGAQPLNGSILPKIHKSLALQSYAVVPQPPPAPAPSSEPAPPVSPVYLTKELFSSSKAPSDRSIFTRSKVSTADASVLGHSKVRSTRSDDASTQPNESEDPLREFSDSEDDVYAKQFDDQRCYDAGVPLEEAMKQVVLPEGVRSTCEEVLVRLTSMWAAYDLQETLASLPPERLSQRVSFSIDQNEYAF